MVACLFYFNPSFVSFIKNAYMGKNENSCTKIQTHVSRMHFYRT